MGFSVSDFLRKSPVLDAFSHPAQQERWAQAVRDGGYPQRGRPTGVGGVGYLGGIGAAGAAGVARGPYGVLAPVVGTAGATAGGVGFTPSPAGVAYAPATDWGMTPTEQLLAIRAREAAAKQAAKAAMAPRTTVTSKTRTGTKPGAAPSTRGRTVVGAAPLRPAARPQAAPPTMYSSIPAGLGYGYRGDPMYTSGALGAPPPTPAYGGANAAQMAGLANFLGIPSGPPVQSQQQIADFIASPGAVTGPVSPYATMNQYGGTSGPPATSIQNSQQAAAIAARNATADQLGSAEFRATLDQLLREAGLPAQFGTPDAALALRDYRP